MQKGMVLKMKKIISLAFAVAAFLSLSMTAFAQEVSNSTASGSASGNTSAVGSTLEIMGKGMLGIFVVILVIWGLVALLNKTTSAKKEAPVVTPAAPVAPAANAIPNRGELIAAVSAAVAEELGEDVSAIRIHSFKKIG